METNNNKEYIWYLDGHNYVWPGMISAVAFAFLGIQSNFSWVEMMQYDALFRLIWISWAALAIGKYVIKSRVQKTFLYFWLGVYWSFVFTVSDGIIMVNEIYKTLFMLP
jgi:hypothetical protein